MARFVSVLNRTLVFISHSMEETQTLQTGFGLKVAIAKGQDFLPEEKYVSFEVQERPTQILPQVSTSPTFK